MRERTNNWTPTMEDLLGAVQSTMPIVLWSCAFAIAGAGALFIMYRRIDTDWPESYSSVRTVADQLGREGALKHFLIFRGGPVFLVTLFVAIMTERQGGLPWASVATLLAIHLGYTNVRAIVRIVRQPKNSHRPTLISRHLGVITVVSAISLAALVLRPHLSRIVPATDDLLTAVWAGLFASLFLASARYFMSTNNTPCVDRIEKLQSDIGNENWKYIAEAADRNNSDPHLLRAVILAEVEQRPRWFRRLERLRGLISPSGTYGIAQVKSPKPISDKSSVDQLAKQFAGYQVPDQEDNSSGRPDLHERLLLHNPDPAHADRIIDFYNQHYLYDDTFYS